LNGKERLFNIMVTDERKTSVIHYVGICLENGLVSRSRERDFSIAISSIICDIVQSSIDISNHDEEMFKNKKIVYAGAIDDPNIKEIFDKIVEEKSSLAFYWELKKKIEFGIYFSESRYRNLAKNDFLLNFFSEVRMNVFNRPVKIENEVLNGSELRKKYRTSKYITKIGEILSLSRLFEESEWNKFCYVALAHI
jgi:hypothetical protein